VEPSLTIRSFGKKREDAHPGAVDMHGYASMPVERATAQPH
jgi:hypothetical protein